MLQMVVSTSLLASIAALPVSGALEFVVVLSPEAFSGHAARDFCFGGGGSQKVLPRQTLHSIEVAKIIGSAFRKSN